MSCVSKSGIERQMRAQVHCRQPTHLDLELAFLWSSQLPVSCAGADDSTLFGHKYASGMMSAFWSNLSNLPIVLLSLLLLITG